MAGCTGDPAVPRAELRRDAAVIACPPSSSRSDRVLERWWTSPWTKMVRRPLLFIYTLGMYRVSYMTCGQNIDIVPLIKNSFP